ncbi:MAG: hypothetical protein KIT87_26525 [Anaerolineae bacterium]|nr:hypothetical protein [Anaerolineae bacterium]
MTQALQAQLAADVRRRAQLVPQAIAEWRTLTQTNRQGMGIHQSQVEAVNLLFDALQGRVQAALARLDPDAEAEPFARALADVEYELRASNSLLAVFRLILAQRQASDTLRAVLDAADLVAADCYRTWIVKAREWGVLSETQFREPPLTYLNALRFPAAYTRDHVFGAFKLPLEGYLDQKLPISVIALPFSYAVAVWNFCALYHEVGHPLDQDLGLRSGLAVPLSDALTQRAVDGDPPTAERVRAWSLWLGEALADAVGVLQGGSAFAYALVNLLVKPAVEVTRLTFTDVHPNAYVRLFLVGALLRATGATALVQTAQAVEDLWRARYGQPDGLLAYVQDCPLVAQTVLDTPLSALRGHRLRDFAPTLAQDEAQTGALAEFLAFDTARPNPKTVPYRLIPAAALQAVRLLASDDPGEWQGVQDRALAFVAAKDRPTYLASRVIPPQRAAYLTSLVTQATWGDDETP